MRLCSSGRKWRETCAHTGSSAAAATSPSAYVLICPVCVPLGSIYQPPLFFFLATPLWRGCYLATLSVFLIALFDVFFLRTNAFNQRVVQDLISWRICHAIILITIFPASVSSFRVCSTNSWSPKPATPNPKSSIWRWRETTTDIWPKLRPEIPETVRIIWCQFGWDGALPSSEDAAAAAGSTMSS